VEQIASFERELDIRFPPGLRKHYLRANGGYPEPYNYEDEIVDTVVQGCLPLQYDGYSAITAYKDQILKKSVLPKHFFPFAYDPGGNLFYVDCSSANGMVYLHWHDVTNEPLIALNVDIDEFWSRLKPDKDA
jgi:hypothetical protein